MQRLLLLLALLVLPATMLHAFLLPLPLRPSFSSSSRPLQRLAAAASTTRRFSSTSSSSAATPADGAAGAGGTGAARPSAEEAQATFARVFPSATSDAAASVDHRPVVLFDGVCAFCNRGVDTILKLDVNRKLRFAPLQSDVGRGLMEACGRDPDDLSSMVVVEADRRLFLKSDAAIRIAEVAAPHPALGAAFEKAARLLLPQGVRDGAYDTVAENRYSILGKRDSCRLPDPGDDRFLA